MPLFYVAVLKHLNPIKRLQQQFNMVYRFQGYLNMQFKLLKLLIVLQLVRDEAGRIIDLLAVFALNFVLMHVVPGTQAWQSFAHGWAALGG